MKGRFTFFSALCLAGMLYSPSRAEELLSHAGLFANAKEVFRPLVADPREIQLALRLTTPVSQPSLGDIAAGDYVGLYRWVLPWQNAYVQWSIGGALFARFDLVSPQKDNQLIDYLASMPVDLRIGKWSLRMLPFHISSHLGDDYIKRTGILPEKHSIDSLKWLIAFDPLQSLRIYGGYNYILRNTNSGTGRSAVQGGAEWTSAWWAKGHAQLYWANDVQSWERVAWNPDFNSQLGIRFAHDPEDKQTISVFTEYGAGHLPYDQIFQQQESHWVLGLKFVVS